MFAANRCPRPVSVSAPRLSKKAVASVEKELGEDGRILVRESGTEPVIRVMVEAKKDAICREMVQRVIEVMDKEGLILS